MHQTVSAHRYSWSARTVALRYGIHEQGLTGTERKTPDSTTAGAARVGKEVGWFCYVGQGADHHGYCVVAAAETTSQNDVLIYPAHVV